MQVIKKLSDQKNIAKLGLEWRAENDNISVDRPITFAIGSIYLKIDTTDGKHQLHGTATVVYQQKSEDEQLQ